MEIADATSILQASGRSVGSCLASPARNGREQREIQRYRDRKRRAREQEGGREKRDRHDLAGYEGQRPPVR